MKKLCIAAFLFLNTVSFSQKYELGEVTIDELKQKVCPSDTSTAAVYLFNIGKSHFDYDYDEGFQVVTEISTKIKIYKKEGYDYANYAVAYYVGGNGNEKVSFSKAITYNLVNGKIEKTKLSGDSTFDEKVNSDYKRKKITMPNVKEGSIIEYKIEIKSPYIWNFPEWEFQKRIPVNYSAYTTSIPEYYIYNVHLKGFLSPSTVKEEKYRKIQYTYKTNAMPGGNNSHGSERVNSELNFNEKSAKYTLVNVPALIEEQYTNNIDNYRSTLIHELSGKRLPNQPDENFTTNWENVTQKIYVSQNFGDELKKTGYFEKDIDALISGVTSQQERIGIIFNYVKSTMNWNESSRYFCTDGVKKAYQDKKGNSAEINLMLTAMLRYAGIEANPVLVSTRSNGISIFPSQSAFNYVISGVELTNQVVLLDATSKFSLPDILPLRALNWTGRIIRKNGSSAAIDLMPKSNSKEVITIMGSINSEGIVAGKIRDQYFDYNAFLFRVRNSNIAKESYVEKIEKAHQGLEIGDYEVQNVSDLSKPIIENYAFTANNSVEIIGDKMYFSPFLFLATTENPFKQETRQFPIDFVYPTQEKYNISITIPDGYAVETLPQSKALSMPDDLSSLKYNISSNGNQVQIMYTLDSNQAIISNEYYETLKNFYKEIVNKQTEKIVLKKV